MTAEDPPCPTCAGPTSRNYFPVAAIWTKALASYGDKSKETYHKDARAGGHWSLESKSDRAVEAGKPIKVFLETPQQQAEYCKREGLVNPKELPNNLTIAKDGKSYEKNNISEI